MNIENLKLLRDSIEKSMAFDMTDWPIFFSEYDVEFNNGHYCGSAACIGGHAEALMIHNDDISGVATMSEVRLWLDLSPIDANRLFFPNLYNCGVSISNITQEHAVRCLDHLIKTGEVNWSGTA